MDKHTLFYMHTIDGQPAFFDGEQLVYAERRDHWEDDYSVVVLCTSEEQVREEQRASIAYRKQHKWTPSRYDFVIVSLTPGRIPPPGQKLLHYGGRKHPGYAPA